MSGFPEALAHLRIEECDPRCIAGEHYRCFHDDKDDPGGATCCGIIQRTYDGFRAAHGLEPRSVGLHTWDEYREIFEHRFWLRGRCDALPWPLALVHFDGMVNEGKNAPAQLQRALRVADDGEIGPVTLAAAARAPLPEAAYRYLLERVAYYDSLDVGHPERTKFLTGGWLGRLERLYRTIG